jgi:hypothetical protein
MSMRSLHVVHLLVRHNRPDGQTGFLVYPHEHWKAPDGHPYFALPAKKTASDPLAEFIEGTLLDAYVEEIALKEWGMQSDAFAVDREFEPAEWTMPSSGQKDDDYRALPTRYTVHPVEIWLAPEHREPLRQRLQGRWLTALEALEEPRLSPTARGVFVELTKRHEHLQSHPPGPEVKHKPQQAEALGRLFGPVSDRPGTDAQPRARHHEEGAARTSPVQEVGASCGIQSMQGKTAHTSPAGPQGASSGDEMHDTEADMARWPALAPMLRTCAELVEPAFRRADKAALRHQWSHRQLTKLATIFGAAAVIFAILQLAFADMIGAHVLTMPELIAVVLAFLAVGLGIRVAFQANWLLARNKAERLRLAKFRFLIDPDVWSGGPSVQARKRAELEEKVRMIQESRPSDLHQWVERDTVPDPPPQVLALRVLPAAGGELLDYYCTRRLHLELAFFRKRADQNFAINKYTKLLSPILFFGSVGAVLIHFGSDLRTGDEKLDTLSRWLIVLAASLPVVGGTIRTFHTAYGFAPNTYRYRAKAVALASIDSALQRATDARSQFLGLWLCEETLETEHREWLRLMLEAEWFA